MSRSTWFEKAKSFTKSMLSRGLGLIEHSRRASSEIKAIRQVSCNGQEERFPPCEHRQPSQNHPGSYICGACGCGDRQAVLIGGRVPAYSKLDYPYLSCPIYMPGFSNYVPSGQDEESNERKVHLELKYGVERLNAIARGQKRGFFIESWRRKARKVFTR